jgi:hypothetical protein
VVFSKDRACQLDQLLDSLKAHVPNLAGVARVKVMPPTPSASPCEVSCIIATSPTHTQQEGSPRSSWRVVLSMLYRAGALSRNDTEGELHSDATTSTPTATARRTCTRFTHCRLPLRSHPAPQFDDGYAAIRRLHPDVEFHQQARPRLSWRLCPRPSRPRAEPAESSRSTTSRTP